MAYGMCLHLQAGLWACGGQVQGATRLNSPAGALYHPCVSHGSGFEEAGSEQRHEACACHMQVGL